MNRPRTSNWFVVLTEPQQDISTVWRLHELGLELFVPVLRKRVKTGRVGKNGQPVTKIVAKPMFPGYGFIREGVWSSDEIRAVRGVRDFMMINDRMVVLPDDAITAVFKKQNQQQHAWLDIAADRRHSPWKRGDRVRIDADGGAYAGLIATVDQIDGKGRIELLLGMIRHIMPSEMVIAA